MSQEMTLEIKFSDPIRSVVVSPQLINLPPDFVNIREIRQVSVRDRDTYTVDVHLYSGLIKSYNGTKGLDTLRQLEAHCNPAMILETSPVQEGPPIPSPFGPATIPGWSKLSALDAGRSKEANQTVFEWAAAEIERLRAKCLRAGLGA